MEDGNAFNYISSCYSHFLICLSVWKWHLNKYSFKNSIGFIINSNKECKITVKILHLVASFMLEIFFSDGREL